MSVETLEHADQVEERPACSIAIQLRKKSFRREQARVFKPTFEPCGNAQCFPGVDELDDDEPVVVAAGSGTSKMHRPRES